MNARRANAPLAAASGTGGEWLTPLAGHWIDAAAAHLSEHRAVVRVTVVALRGSAPREPGASMLVGSRSTVGTIGGGHLEWHATRAARELLSASGAAAVRFEDLILGPQLEQCCGGRVELWLERLTRNDLPWLRAAAQRVRDRGGVAFTTELSGGVVTRRLLRGVPGAAGLRLRRATLDRMTLLEMINPRRPPLWIFGAGHVGQALVRLLAELALFEIAWADSRPELLPADLPECVTTHTCAALVDLLGTAQPGSRYVVMTHDHALDYELCRRVLLRGDAAWLGLIGSASKAARFRSRLRRDGISADRLSGLTCPIGVQGVTSKLPAAIAIAIGAQLLQQCGAARKVGEPQACSESCRSCGTRSRRDA
ncbi:MAG TPA: xanthine dehydrogenase accessory protein XdhC [Steroidobacteraceae bacterium]|nr:xanthine dehydrogenase accessory protein XdhC [Steroidobacteraceae bacterium]